MARTRRRSYRNNRPAGWKSRLSRIILVTLAILLFTPLTLGIIYRFVPVPATPLMFLRLSQGYGLHKQWQPLNRISPNLRMAVVASEDNLFCDHSGFDWKSLNKAYNGWQAGHAKKGGSTISMQVAKNIYLVPTRAVWRKALEIPLTAMLEALWPKQRILEVYLNVAEWGPGIYGAEAAAQYHFKTHAHNLTLQQAARLAAILPLPLKWSARNPGPYVATRARAIQHRIYQLGPTYLFCTQPNT